MGSKVLVFVAAIAGATALTSVAFAQSGVATCVTDDECPTGQWCPSAHASDPDEPKPYPGAAPESGATRDAIYFSGETSACEALPKGVCESAKDCGAGFTCEKSQGTSGCGPSVDGDTSDCDTRVMTSRYGSCELAPIACVTNSDCPYGLTCVSEEEPVTDLPGCARDDGDCAVGGGSGGSTGSAGPKAAAKYCDYVPEECSKDSECGANFECLISEVKACSSAPRPTDCGGSVEEGSGAASADCAESAPLPPECETVSTEGWCFPKKMPCTVDAQCPNDYVCYEFEAGQTPDAWNASSSLMSCLPEGLALIARFAGRGLDTVGDSPSGGDGKGESTNGNALDPDGKASGSGDGSACSVSSTHSGSAWILSVVGLLGLCLVRRRGRAA